MDQEDDDEGDDDEMPDEGEQDKASFDEEVERNTEANMELTADDAGKPNGVASSSAR